MSSELFRSLLMKSKTILRKDFSYPKIVAKPPKAKSPIRATLVQEVLEANTNTEHKLKRTCIHQKSTKIQNCTEDYKKKKNA